MKIIQKFDSNNVELIRDVLDKTLKELFQTTGIKFNIGRITYAPNEFNCKLTALIVDINNPEEVNTSVKLLKYKKDFESNCWKFGLKLQDLGTRKSIQGVNYKLIGSSTSSKKYPLICRKSDGKIIKLTVTYWESGSSFVKPTIDNIDSYL